MVGRVDDHPQLARRHDEFEPPFRVDGQLVLLYKFLVVVRDKPAHAQDVEMVKSAPRKDDVCLAKSKSLSPKLAVRSSRPSWCEPAALYGPTQYVIGAILEPNFLPNTATLVDRTRRYCCHGPRHCNFCHFQFHHLFLLLLMLVVVV
jgi:hypothetical protein